MKTHVTRAQKSNWTRIVATVAIATLAVLGVATPAHADVQATISDLKFTSTSVEHGRSSMITGNWSVPDTAMGTARFDLILPAELRGQPQKFAVTAGDGSDVGTCVVEYGVFSCEIDLTSPYYLANPIDRHGSFEFRVNVRTEVSEETEVTYTIAKQELTITVEPRGPASTCTRDCEYNGHRGDKQGWTSGDELWWLINPPVGADGHRAGQTVVVEDEPVGNHRVDSSSWIFFGASELKTVNGKEEPAFNRIWTAKNPTEIPESPTMSADGTTISFEPQEGWYYRFWLQTTATDAGASVEYTNRATITVDTETPVVAAKTNVWAGGNATGIGTGLARFSLAKVVDVEGAEAAGVDFSESEFRVRWTVTTPDNTVSTGIAAVTPGQNWVSDLFPEQSRVQLQELTPTAVPGVNWTSSRFSQNDFVMPNRSDTLVTLTNTGNHEPTVGGFTLTKLLELPDGVALADGTEFEVSWTATPPRTSDAEMMTGTLLLAPGETAEVHDLPVGSVVRLVENLPSAPPGTRWSAPAFSTNDFTIVPGNQEAGLTAVELTNTATVTPSADPPPIELPATGADSSALALGAGAALLLGLVLASQRRARS